MAGSMSILPLSRLDPLLKKAKGNLTYQAAVFQVLAGTGSPTCPAPDQRPQTYNVRPFGQPMPDGIIGHNRPEP